MVVIRDKNNRFWGKIYQTFLWQFKFKEWKGTRMWKVSYENCIIRIITFCSLKLCLQFFLTQVCVFYRKKSLIFSYYNVKIHPLPFKSSMFSLMLFSKRNSLQKEESLQSKNSKNSTYTILLHVPFHSSKLVCFIENWFWEKEILTF